MVKQMSSWRLKPIARVDDYLANNIIKRLTGAVLSSWYCRSKLSRAINLCLLRASMSVSFSRCHLSNNVGKRQTGVVMNQSQVYNL